MRVALVLVAAWLAGCAGLIVPRPTARGGVVALRAGKDDEVRRILEERNRRLREGSGGSGAASGGPPRGRGGSSSSLGDPRTPPGRRPPARGGTGGAGGPQRPGPGGGAARPSLFVSGEDRRQLSGVSSKDVTTGAYWGALEVAHRLGASTGSWGVPANGWTTKKNRKKRRADQFGVDDATEAFRTLTLGGFGLWETAAGSAGARTLDRVAKAADLDVGPRLACRVAPGLRSRALGLFFRAWGRKDGVARLEKVKPPTVIARPSTKKNIKKKPKALIMVGPDSGGFLTPYLLPKMQRRVSGRIWNSAQRAAEAAGTDEIGVANIRGGRALRAAHKACDRRGLRLVAASLSLSLLDAAALEDGTLKVAKELDITVLARSPLAAGLCSGKCTVEDPTGGAGFGAAPKWRYRALRQLQPLHEALATVAEGAAARLNNPGVTPTQVALAWVIANGAVPLPAVKTKAHAQEILGCKGWALNDEELDQLNDARPRAMPNQPMLPQRR